MRIALTMAAAAAVLALPLLGVGACSGKRKMGPALAEVHDAKLRGRMADLRQLAVIDLSDATRSATTRGELARIGAELQVTAARIPDHVYALDLDEDDRSYFVAFADSLRASAARLEAEAPTASGPVLEERIQEVTDACAGCHWAFRVSPEED